MSGISLKELYVYPIKSAGSVAFHEARLDSRGIEYDRRWMLGDESRKFMSQRKYPRMALIYARLSPERLVVEAPGRPELHLSLRPEERPNTEVRVWSDTVSATPVEDGAEEWFGAFLGVRCRLVYMPDHEVRRVDQKYAERWDQVGFADGFTLLLISQASVDDLGERLDRRIPVDRFRPKLVVEGSSAFGEDQ